MSYEKKLLRQIVASIYNSDFGDNIVVARLTDSLDGVLEDLEQLYKKTGLLSYQLDDYIYNISYGRGLIVVLQAFTTDDYLSETILLNKYDDKLREVF